MMNVGKRTFIKDSFEVAEEYLKIAKNDENTALILENQKLYNQAAYFYIQAMEKYVKHKIAQKINILNKHFAEEISKTTGHSLDKSLDLLIKVYCGSDEYLREQMSRQLDNYVLKNLNFRHLNNSLRYPIYSDKNGNYVLLVINKSDCEEFKKILESLKNYLNDLNRVN